MQDASSAISSALKSLGLQSQIVPLPVSKHHASLLPDIDLFVKATSIYAEDLIREADLATKASHLTQSVPTLASGVPAPYQHEGWTFLFYEQLHPVGLPTKRQLVDSLLSLSIELESLTGLRSDWLEEMTYTTRAAKHLPSSVEREMNEYFETLCAPVLNASWDIQPVHADAHNANAMLTSSGVKWVDLESLKMGPLAYSLSSMRDIHALVPDVPSYRAFVGMRLYTDTVWSYYMAQRDERWADRANKQIRRVRRLAPKYAHSI